MCVCVCVHVFMRVHAFCVWARASAYVCVYACVCVYGSMRACMRACRRGRLVHSRGLVLRNSSKEPDSENPVIS